MNVESRLTELVGEPGRRLHTARSRNDQVATDLKLYARAACAEIVTAIDRGPAGAVPAGPRRTPTRLLPGYTHLQRAQVVTLGHHLLAYAEMLGRDRGRFVDAARRANQSPLGAGALAGTSLPIDRERTAAALGFAEPDPQQPGHRLRPGLRRRDRLRLRADGACTCPAWARSWCCGRPPSSGSCAWARATARAAR